MKELTVTDIMPCFLELLAYAQEVTDMHGATMSDRDMLRRANDIKEAYKGSFVNENVNNRS